jgi:hypothetical protein
VFLQSMQIFIMCVSVEVRDRRTRVYLYSQFLSPTISELPVWKRFPPEMKNKCGKKYIMYGLEKKLTLKEEKTKWWITIVNINKNERYRNTNLKKTVWKLDGKLFEKKKLKKLLIMWLNS